MRQYRAATEVRNLAQRSASAAKEIKELISDSVSKLESGSRQVTDARKTIEDIVTAVQKVTSIMNQITTASMDQSSGIEQVNQAVMQMDDVTQQNAALVEQAAAAEALQLQGHSLVQGMGVIRLGNTQPAFARKNTGITERKANISRAAAIKVSPKKITAGQKKPSNRTAEAIGKNEEWKAF